MKAPKSKLLKPEMEILYSRRKDLKYCTQIMHVHVHCAIAYNYNIYLRIHLFSTSLLPKELYVGYLHSLLTVLQDLTQFHFEVLRLVVFEVVGICNLYAKILS